MKLIKGLLARQPLLINSVITAAVGLAIAYGAPIPPEAKAPLISLLVALALAVTHQSVASPATVVQVAKDTVQSLSGPTAGAVGTVTAKGAELIDTVVSEVGGLVGALAPKAKEVS